MKHVDIRMKYVAERIETGDLTVLKIESKQNIADVFTKPLPKDAFQKMKLCLRITKFDV